MDTFRLYQYIIENYREVIPRIETIVWNMLVTRYNAEKGTNLTENDIDKESIIILCQEWLENNSLSAEQIEAINKKIENRQLVVQNRGCFVEYIFSRTEGTIWVDDFVFFVPMSFERIEL